MRGKEVDSFGFLCGLGITPAYAGKRLMSSNSLTAHRDHPRVCGEKKSKSVKTGRHAGSPPRMRGKELQSEENMTCGRITPAYAGKRLRPEKDGSPSWDHPRVCGEKLLVLVRLTYRMGSPPRMRGKAHFNFVGVLLPGITPAYAGKSVHLLWRCQ